LKLDDDMMIGDDDDDDDDDDELCPKQYVCSKNNDI